VGAGDLAAALVCRIRSCHDHAAADAGESNPPLSHGVENPEYSTALDEIDRLIRHRINAARQHSGHDQDTRRMAMRSVEANGHLAPSHESIAR
jgi:hypothetical protein